jgi:hypothetical protein
VIAAVAYLGAMRDQAVGEGGATWVLLHLARPWNFLHADKSWYERLLGLSGFVLGLGLIIFLASIDTNVNTNN